MTLPGTRRWLYAAALLLLPLPMLQFDAFVPVVRYLLLAGVTLGLIVAEGGGEIPYLFLGLIFGHALVYGLLLWVATRFLATRLWSYTPRNASRIVLVASGIACLLAIVTRPYVTPYSAISLHSNLWVLFQ